MNHTRACVSLNEDEWGQGRGGRDKAGRGESILPFNDGGGELLCG